MLSKPAGTIWWKLNFAYCVTNFLSLNIKCEPNKTFKKMIIYQVLFEVRIFMLQIAGSPEHFESSNIDMNQLNFDLTLFKSLQKVEVCVLCGTIYSLPVITGHNISKSSIACCLFMWFLPRLPVVCP